MEITERGIPGKRGDYRSKNRRLYVKKTRILMSRKVEIASMVKSKAETFAYWIEGKSLVVLQVNYRSVYDKALE